ncbi:MAG TPA: peptidoglycan DD-metalloendopeptidase family protein [Candidatus Paceibacterota bacterium]
MTKSSNIIFGILSVFAALAAVFLTHSAFAAESPEAIRAKIEENNRKIDDLQRQIDQYSTLLNSTSAQAQSLKSALSQLETTQKKLQANLSLTATQIDKTSLTLGQLEDDIDDAEAKISVREAAIAESMRNVSAAESQSFAETLLSDEGISSALDYVNSLRSVQGRVKVDLEELRDLRMLLGARRDQATGEKTKLEAYRKSLADQQKVVASTKTEKDKLLTETKNREANYKAILDDKVAQREQYEKELFAYESQLKITLDPNAIPNARHSILEWPLSVIRVTQYFGKTVAAKRLYTSGTHGGIDLAASIGTPVKAALSGTVVDTEAVRSKSGCQYGKFVLIKHPNGLSTIYGHLSVVSVSPGDTVVTGDTIGYSGQTGYATGPHLHFGVYATAGVRVVDSSSLGSTNCAGIKTVAAPPTAYLDPSAYLPAL